MKEREGQEVATLAQSTSAQDGPAAPEVEAPARKGSGVKIVVILLLAAIVVAAGTWLYFHYRDRVSSDDAEVDGHISAVSSKVAGNVVDVLVLDNQPVKAGDVLVRIDPCLLYTSWGNADFDAFRASDPAVAAAFGTDVAQLSGASAAGTGEIELHGSGHLRDVAGTLALRAVDFTGTGGAGAMAGAADFVTGDLHAGLGAVDGLPEIDTHSILEIAAFFRLGLIGALTPAEELGKDIAKATAGFGAPSAGAASGRVRKIEAAEIHSGVGALGAATRRGRGRAVFGIEAVLIVHLALFGIAQDVVRFLHVLEAIFGGFIPGVEIGMVFAGEFPVRLAHFVFGRFARDPQGLVIFVFGSGRHKRNCLLYTS